MLCTWRVFFACSFHKCLAGNELSEDDSHGSEDNCAEVNVCISMVETTMKSMMMMMTSVMLNFDNAKHRRAKTSTI